MKTTPSWEIASRAQNYRDLIANYPGLQRFMLLVRDRSGNKVAAEVWHLIEGTFDPDRAAAPMFEEMPSFVAISTRPRPGADHVQHWMRQLQILISLKNAEMLAKPPTKPSPTVG